MLKIYYFWTVYNCPKCTKHWIMYKKIKGILFDFDGVIAESEQIWFGTALVTLKKMGIKYIDYKDPDFLMRFLNEQGKILPRRITGNSLKFQRRLAVAVKRARQIALLPFVGDNLK